MTCCSVLDVTPTSDDRSPGCLPTANAHVSAHEGKSVARPTNPYLIDGKGDLA